MSNQSGGSHAAQRQQGLNEARGEELAEGKQSAPTVTIEDVQRAVRRVDYTILPDRRTTICTLTLDNGFTVRGESSCVSIENFDRDKGEQYAYEAAQSKVWQFLGFRLADKLAQQLPGQPFGLAGRGVEPVKEMASSEAVRGTPLFKPNVEGALGRVLELREHVGLTFDALERLVPVCGQSSTPWSGPRNVLNAQLANVVGKLASDS